MSRLTMTMVALALVVGCAREDGHGDGGGHGHAQEASWTCPMHPQVRQDGPGQCPICHMDLVRVEAAGSGGAGRDVVVHEQGRRLAGIDLVAAKKGPLVASVRAPGRVGFDETRVFDVTLRVNGYVDRLFIDAVGSAVDKGAPLAWIESPQLAQAQLELLRAVEAAGSDAILGASRQRLLVLGMTDTQIDEVVASKTPLQPVPILAAQSGVVVAKDVVAGQSVSPGMRLVRLARMDKVWVEADVFPDDAAQLRPAQPAKVRLLGSRAAPLAAKVARILPTQGGGASSTVKVRIDVENAGRALVPGSSVIVEIAAVRADALLVPRDAVIPTGARNVVFVDVGGERFMARDVEVGEHSEDDVEIRAGLVEGERVVRRGAFLVAAESRLRAPAAWSAAPSAPVAVPPPSKPAHPHDGGAP